MENKLTLWQRCEALGPQSNSSVALHRMEVRDGTGIVWFVGWGKTTVARIKYCISMGCEPANVEGNAWLAEAIILKFEALASKPESKPDEPTSKQVSDLWSHCEDMSKDNLEKMDLRIHCSNMQGERYLEFIRQDKRLFSFHLDLDGQTFNSKLS